MKTGFQCWGDSGSYMILDFSVGEISVHTLISYFLDTWDQTPQLLWNGIPFGV